MAICGQPKNSVIQDREQAGIRKQEHMIVPPAVLGRSGDQVAMREDYPIIICLKLE